MSMSMHDCNVRLVDPDRSPRRRAVREPHTLSSAIAKERRAPHALVEALRSSKERVSAQGQVHAAHGDTSVAAIVARAEMTIEGVIGVVDHIKQAVAPAEERSALEALSHEVAGMATGTEGMRSAQATPPLEAASHDGADSLADGLLSDTPAAR